VPDLPCSIPTLNLTFSGDYSENVQADEEVWGAYERGQVYWVEKTNLLLSTMRPWTFNGTCINCYEQPVGRAGDNPAGFHGTMTTGAVNDACSDCYVFALQDSNSLDGKPVREIARNQTYIDVVTSSNVPGETSDVPFQGDQDYANATYELWQTGRPFMAFAGNQGVAGLRPNTNPFPFAEVQFPPWVYLVGGAHPECQASNGLAGKPPELVGDFTQRLPVPVQTSGRSNVSGTSFAAPQVAAEIGELVVDLRQRFGFGNATNNSLYEGPRIENSAFSDGVLELPELREAVHYSAVYFETSEYQPGCGTSVVTPGASVGGTPVTLGPYTQMGWGYVGDNATDTALDVILGETPLPEKSEDAKRFMEAFRETRETLYPWPNESES
jgi:hypothetical protein